MTGNNGNPWGGYNPRGNRPNNNNGGGKEPPDLQTFFREAQKKFQKTFNDNSGGKFGYILVASAVVVGWMLTGFYLVKTGEQGVVLRFGKYVSTTAAGLNYHLPYPIETASLVDMEKNRNLAVGYNTPSQTSSDYAMYSSTPKDERQMLTGDENIVNIEFDVRWKVAKADDFLFNVRNPEQTVQAVAESVMREVIGRNKIDTILTGGRDLIEASVRDEMQKTLDNYEAGIRILQIAVKDASPPEAVSADFKDVQAARQDQDRFTQEANAYANKILPQARGQAAKLKQEAEAYKQRAVAEALGDTSRFNQIYEQYKKAPEVTRKRLYLETIEEALGDKKKILLSGEGTGSVVPYMSVEQLLKNRNNDSQ